jgi:beta-galactosidase
MPARAAIRLAAVCLFLAISFTAPAQTSSAPYLGAAWYPEQWPESQWDHDLALMQAAHFNVVRIGEFAWSTEEPTEGHYDLDWLARAVTLAAQHNLKVVLGTPTDAPPAWLTQKYPQTLGTDANGHRAEHGNRRQFNYAKPLYRQFCRQIDTALAQRFGHNPDVIGWQIGNEYTDESFDPATVAQFQHFLHAKYKTLASLNQHWTTAYWSQTYTAWSQIPMENTGGNPGLLLDHKHFVTATWRSFQQNQIDTLRPLITSSQFITTNIGGLGWSDNWDHYAITAPLDLSSWDDYVGQGHLNVARNAMLNDFVRGWKRQNFWVMETEPGSVNWAPINNALYPGETRALAWQAIGHGADAILYWQWRDALNGQEQYHGDIAGPGGSPLPIYAEIAHLGHDLDLTRATLAGTTPHASIALLYTYDSRWAIDFQPHTRLYDQQQILLDFYTPLERLAEHSGQAIDIVDPATAPLARYKLLVAPSLNVISEPLAAKLLAYVQAGGDLILGPRSGMKDQYNALNPQRQPGPLAAALGARVSQFYALDPTTPPPTLSPVASTSGGDLLAPENTSSRTATSGKASIWAEPLAVSTPGATIDSTYTDPGGWLDHQPAMLTRRIGQGTLSYLGTIPDPATLSGLLTRYAPALPATILPANPPATLELCTRSSATGTVTILINHAQTPMTTPLLHPMRDLLDPTHPTPITSITLPAQGVAILTPYSNP